jgi:hypothetical protein
MKHVFYLAPVGRGQIAMSPAAFSSPTHRKEEPGLNLPMDVELLDPVAARPKYIQALFELRKEKGLSLAPETSPSTSPSANAGEMQTRRVKSTTILAGTVQNFLHYFTPGPMKRGIPVARCRAPTGKNR